MMCQGCQSEAAVSVSWAMSEGPQRGTFCRLCAKAMHAHYPLTPFTFMPIKEAR